MLDGGSIPPISTKRYIEASRSHWLCTDFKYDISFDGDDQVSTAWDRIRALDTESRKK